MLASTKSYGIYRKVQSTVRIPRKVQSIVRKSDLEHFMRYFSAKVLKSS